MDLSRNDRMLFGLGLESEAGHGDLNEVLMAVSGEEEMLEKAMTLQLLIDLALTASGGVRQARSKCPFGLELCSDGV
ncbi:hypothetical protein L1987_35300 [Smallanthus sonchifolius]|uniref:Uncharacterized protein n=1 Tax=Smallanthus sonchifolius TaxID=185202 RepID=A0ACB9HW31_9ASTR|nr:hypothetical protein L1987_35300 [Smallanthus sonchifolius]